jgi:hypothetical protein
VPLVLWLTPASHANGSWWKVALALAVLVVVLIRTLAERQTQPLLDRLVATRPAALRRVQRVADAK